MSQVRALAQTLLKGTNSDKDRLPFPVKLQTGFYPEGTGIILTVVILDLMPCTVFNHEL